MNEDPLKPLDDVHKAAIRLFESEPSPLIYGPKGTGVPVKIKMSRFTDGNGVEIIRFDTWMLGASNGDGTFSVLP